MRDRPGVAVVGSINTDLVVYVPHLPRASETVRGADLVTGGGGKGANQAVAAARLGAEVRFIGRVGTDNLGRDRLDDLRNAGIDVSGVKATDGVPSGVALILVDSAGENVIAVASGANARLSDADVTEARHLLAGCQVLLLQLEVPIEASTRAARLARDAGLTVVLNPAPAPEGDLPLELLELVDVLVPNGIEAGMLTGVDTAGQGGAEEAGRRLLGRGLRATVITLGERGALVVETATNTYVPAPRVKAVDTTGAGDAFCGGLATALARGLSLVAATRYATAAGAAAVTRAGAQASMPEPDAVEALLAAGAEL